MTDHKYDREGRPLYICVCSGGVLRNGCGCRLTNPPTYWAEDGSRRFEKDRPMKSELSQRDTQSFVRLFSSVPYEMQRAAVERFLIRVGACNTTDFKELSIWDEDTGEDREPDSDLYQIPSAEEYAARELTREAQALGLYDKDSEQ